MKSHYLEWINWKLIMIPVFLMLFNTEVFARQEGCWADFYDDAQYQGNHFRLKGPTKKKELTDINGEDWDKRIESMVVGSNAVLTVFENKNFKLTLKEISKHPVLMKSLGITQQDVLEDSELIFQPNSKIHSLSEFSFYHKIRSIKLHCKN